MTRYKLLIICFLVFVLCGYYFQMANTHNMRKKVKAVLTKTPNVKTQHSLFVTVRL